MASGAQVSELAGVQIGVSSVTKLVIEEEGAEIGPSSEIKEAALAIGVENGVSENQLTVVGLKQDTAEAGGLDGANLGELVTEDGGIKEIVGVVGFVNGTALENQLAGSCKGGETCVAHSNQVNAEEQVVGGQIAGSSANQETAVVVGLAVENGVASEDQVNAEEQSVGGKNGFPSSNQVDADEQAVGGEIWVSSANQEAGVVVGISGENGVAFADQVT